MELDALLRHYLGTADLTQAAPDAMADACQRAAIDFGMERDGGRKLALWSLLAVLGNAPDPRDAFDDPAARRAALTLARLLEAGTGTVDG